MNWSDWWSGCICGMYITAICLGIIYIITGA